MGPLTGQRSCRLSIIRRDNQNGNLWHGKYCAVLYSTYRSKLEPFWGTVTKFPPGDSCWVTCMMPAGCSLLLRPLTRCPPRAFQLSLPPIGSGPKPAQRTLGGEGTGTTSQYHHHQQLCAE